MSSPSVLSPIGVKIVSLVAQGLSAQTIADRLQMREQEIEDEVSEILRALGLRSRVELILFAYSRKISKAAA